MLKFCAAVALASLASSSRALAADRPTAATMTCVTQECHADYKKKKYVHGPVAQDVCKFCHKPLDGAKHTFRLFREGWELCSSCHREPIAARRLHRPVQTGDCLACHDPHASDSPFLVPVASVGDLCAKCHERQHRASAFPHTPVKGGECTLCHRPHGADHANLLPAQGNEVCFICHETTREQLRTFPYVHRPVAEKPCEECHDAHGTNHRNGLKKGVPDLCYSCHENVHMLVQGVRHRHEVVGEADGCTACHAPHASTVRYALKSAPLTLCSTCHDKELPTASGEVIANFKAEVENKKSLHGPVAQGQCDGCHLSHGSDHFRLLVREHPAAFYAPFDVRNYALCFTCHAEAGVLDRETVTLTDFRNGTQNLHYAHVNQRPKGRTCRACHATHASDWPKHIRESVPFQQWDLPIQFEKTASGGRCVSGCHEPKAYDRENPVVYPPPASGRAPDMPGAAKHAPAPAQGDASGGQRDGGDDKK